MNRTNRLLAIILELQRKRTLWAEDLAAIFEVSTRTIYRDVQALLEIGVPITSMIGNGFALAEGYFLPALRFSTDEAFMLILGSDFMAQNFDAQYRLAACATSERFDTAILAGLGEKHGTGASSWMVNHLSDVVGMTTIQFREPYRQRAVYRFAFSDKYTLTQTLPINDAAT